MRNSECKPFLSNWLIVELSIKPWVTERGPFILSLNKYLLSAHWIQVQVLGNIVVTLGDWQYIHVFTIFYKIKLLDMVERKYGRDIRMHIPSNLASFRDRAPIRQFMCFQFLLGTLGFVGNIVLFCFVFSLVILLWLILDLLSSFFLALTPFLFCPSLLQPL